MSSGQKPRWPDFRHATITFTTSEGARSFNGKVWTEETP